MPGAKEYLKGLFAKIESSKRALWLPSYSLISALTTPGELNIGSVFGITLRRLQASAPAIDHLEDGLTVERDQTRAELEQKKEDANARSRDSVTVEIPGLIEGLIYEQRVKNLDTFTVENILTYMEEGTKEEGRIRGSSAISSAS